MTPRASELDRVYLQLFSSLHLRQNRIRRFLFSSSFSPSSNAQWKTKQNKNPGQQGEGSCGKEVRIILIFKNLSWLGRKIQRECVWGGPLFAPTKLLVGR